MSNFKAIDLFCGAGGITQGLKDAGFDVVWAIDNDQHCKETYDKNHPAEMVEGDITKTDVSEIGYEEGEIDLVAGGPPCPTYSKVGRTKINSIDGRTNGDDKRHQLYEHFLRFVNELRPKVFLMENVEGMKSAENKDGEPVVDIIKQEMESMGYEVSFQMLDAADFGVPQHRRRVFFIGNRLEKENPDMEEWRSHREPEGESEKGIKYNQRVSKGQQKLSETYRSRLEEFPSFEKNPDARIPWNTVADAIFDLPPVSPEGGMPPKKAVEHTVTPISFYQEWARDIPEDKTWEDVEIKDHESRGHNLRDLTLYKMLGYGTSWTIGGLPDEVQPYRTDIFDDNYKKQNPEKPSSTIVAHLAKDGHMFIHPHEARSLTPREAARLQSFRDTYEFPVSRTQTFRQIGNAVPPLLAQALGEAIRQRLLLE